MGHEFEMHSDAPVTALRAEICCGYCLDQWHLEVHSVSILTQQWTDFAG